jgi:hypothetical protein
MRVGGSQPRLLALALLTGALTERCDALQRPPRARPCRACPASWTRQAGRKEARRWRERQARRKGGRLRDLSKALPPVGVREKPWTKREHRRMASCPAHRHCCRPVLPVSREQGRSASSVAAGRGSERRQASRSSPSPPFRTGRREGCSQPRSSRRGTGQASLLQAQRPGSRREEREDRAYTPDRPHVPVLISSRSGPSEGAGQGVASPCLSLLLPAGRREQRTDEEEDPTLPSLPRPTAFLVHRRRSSAPIVAPFAPSPAAVSRLVVVLIPRPAVAAERWAPSSLCQQPLRRPTCRPALSRTHRDLVSLALVPLLLTLRAGRGRPS